MISPYQYRTMNRQVYLSRQNKLYKLLIFDPIDTVVYSRDIVNGKQTLTSANIV